MLTATIATVLSTLRKPSCSLDIFHPCGLDEVGAKSSVDPASCWLDTEAVSTDIRHPIEGATLSAGKVPLFPEVGHSQWEPSQPGKPRLYPKRQEATISHRQDEPDRILATRSLRSRIERLEARCDCYKLDILKPALEAAQCMASSQGAYEGDNGRVGDVEGLSCNRDDRKTMNTKRRRQRLVRAVGSSVSQSLSNKHVKADVSASRRSRKRRDLDLGISGTPKFKFDDERASRPKLVRLQNRWCRIGGR